MPKNKSKNIRPKIELGTHTTSQEKVAIDHFLYNYARKAVITRDRLKNVAKKMSIEQLEGSTKYWTNYVATIEHLRYQNCRAICKSEKQEIEVDLKD